jgi:predicted type IV restriction endonuclease
MDFKDQIKALGERVSKLKEQIKTEEATKNAFIMPFLQTLGYDVFNPVEVVPEFIADVGTKKGEKVDYAIFKEDKPVILIECKHWAQKLEVHDNQLIRYFTVTKARFGILTNGIRFRFYTDLIEPNVMDTTPFLDIDLTDIKETQIEELKKFHKSYFDVANILSSASELKYVGEIKNMLNAELKQPSDDFVRYFASKAFKGRLTEKVMVQFTDFVKKSVHSVLSDHIQDRLKTALESEKAANRDGIEESTTADIVQEASSLIVTTEDEMESYYIIKSILRQKVSAERIFYRDTQSYFNILLDDNARKTICRLYLNGNKKQIGLFDENKKESKTEISALDDIYQFGDALNTTVDNYLK